MDSNGTTHVGDLFFVTGLVFFSSSMCPASFLKWAKRNSPMKDPRGTLM